VGFRKVGTVRKRTGGKRDRIRFGECATEEVYSMTDLMLTDLQASPREPSAFDDLVDYFASGLARERLVRLEAIAMQLASRRKIPRS
ncbi:MAG: hypothetical protein J7M27_03525, partial [Candidatus Latescibacteria bacterium]|nr:hypothetical protein [Candidatus Latescibacterota bacterium]